MALRIFKVQGPRMGGNKPDNAFPDPKAGHVDGLFGQTTCRKQLKHFARAHDIDRTHLCDHIGRNDGHDLSKAFLRRPRSGHNIADAL